MEHDEMTQAELILLLETLAENIEVKATTAAGRGENHPGGNPQAVKK